MSSSKRKKIYNRNGPDLVYTAQMAVGGDGGENENGDLTLSAKREDNSYQAIFENEMSRMTFTLLTGRANMATTTLIRTPKGVCSFGTASVVIYSKEKSK